MMLRASLVAAGLLIPTLAAAASFAGNWRGEWTDPEFNQRGRTTIRVDRSGHFSGPIDNDTLGLVGTVDGTIAANGATTMRYTYDGGATYGTARGTMRRVGDRLHGEVHFATEDGRSLGDGSFELDDATSTAL